MYFAKLYGVYKDHRDILNPIILITGGAIVFGRSLPYVNLYIQEFILIVFIIDWIVIMQFVKLDFRQTLICMFILFGVSLLMNLISLDYYNELLGNFIYTILLYTFVREFIVSVRNTHDTKHN